MLDIFLTELSKLDNWYEDDLNKSINDTNNNEATL